MKNGIIAIVLLVIGFIGGYAAKGLQIGFEENDVTLQEALQEVKGAKEEAKAETKEETPVTEEAISSIPTEAALQRDFQAFKKAAEGYLNSLVGKDLDPNDFNVFLNTDYKLFYDKNGALLSNKQDTWGNFYQVFINPKKQKIVVQSNGEGAGGYVLATYQQSGNIESCTRGFKEANWDLTRVFLKAGEVCGGDLQ